MLGVCPSCFGWVGGVCDHVGMTVALFNGSPPPPTQPIPPFSPPTALMHNPLAISARRMAAYRAWCGLKWIAVNWAMRSLVYFTLMSMIYLAVYFFRPDLMPGGLTSHGIEIYCYEYRYDLRQQPFTMVCF